MSGPLDIAYAGADQSIRDPIRALPRTPGERFDAELAASMAPDRYFKQTGAMRDLWTDALDKLHAVTGERLENPEDTSLVSRDRATTYRDTTEARAARRQKATDAIRAARTAGADDLPDPENFERYIAEDSRRRRETAASYVDTGNGLAAFGGSVVGESIAPHGLVGFLVPPARLMTLGAEVALGGFVRSVGREALMQGGAGIATQAAGEALDYAARKPLGTQQTAGEIAENVIGAGIGGAVLGGAFRGAHEVLRRWRGLTPEQQAAAPPAERNAAMRAAEALEKRWDELPPETRTREALRFWNDLTPEQRANAPAEVRDAIAVMERAELDRGTNPLPRGAEAAHEAIVEKAQMDVLAGRPARVADDVGAAMASAPGMVRFYHGGEPGDHAGSLWFTTHLPDAQGWASRGDMGVHYVDVPRGDPRVDWGDIANGMPMPTRQELPGDLAVGRRRLDGAPEGPTPSKAESVIADPTALRVEIDPVAHPDVGAAMAYRANAAADSVDGPWMLRGVMPEGKPGVAVESGRVRGTGFDLPERSDIRPGEPARMEPADWLSKYVVARDENGAPIGVLQMTAAEPGGKALDRNAGVTVYVDPAHRRQGIATKLYDAAREAGYDIDAVRGRGDLTESGAALNAAMTRETAPNYAERMARSEAGAIPPPTREQVDANVKAAESPEAFRALDTEVARIMAADPDKVIMLAIGDEGARPVKIATLLEDARAAEAEAQAAASCVMGAAL